MAVSADIDRNGEKDIAAARSAAAGFEEAVGLAAAALDRLARDGADGDGTGRERVAAVLARRAALEAALVPAILELDADGERFLSAFERLKRGEGGGPAFALLRRRREAPAPPDPARLLALSGAVEDRLRRAEGLVAVLSELRDALKRSHAQAETALSGAIERRGAALSALEASQKAVEEMHAPLTGVRLRIAGAADDADRASLEAERARIEADLGAAKAREAALLAAHRALDDLAALFDVLLGAVNGGIAALNAMIGKLCVDAERGVLLHGAVVSSAMAAGAGGAEAFFSDTAGDGFLGALLARARKGWLDHAETMRRKALADDLFARRFAAPAGEGGRG